MNAQTIQPLLSAHFPASQVKAKPLGKPRNDGRCLAAFYVDAKEVTARLDEVLGIAGWSDSYQVLPDGSAVCTLRIKVDGEWVERTDVGSAVPGDSGGIKAVFSNALKRAALKAGIGRYLYRISGVYGEHDGKRWTKQPQLPPWALPQATPAAATKPDATPVQFITESQWATIKEAITKNNGDARRLLAHFKVTCPRELPITDYEAALKLAQTNGRAS